MKFNFFVLVLFLSYNTGFSQQGNRTGASGKDSTQQHMPLIGKVMGLLKDSINNQPVEFGSVALLRVRDSSVVGGGLTTAKGQFLIEDLPPGRYILKIHSLGYRKMDSKPFMITPNEPIKDFGVVYLGTSHKNLKEVEVASEKVDYVNSIDKKVFNVEKDIVNSGGNASDVLKNIPSVQVDIDGKVSLRGSENFQLLIDGKPSGLGGGDKAVLLQQLPANVLEQIEIITNPSARYDAEGMAGIINIKTKKDKRNGWNGTINGGIGSRDKYNAGITLNHRTSKVAISAIYNYREDNRFSYGYSLRENFYSDSKTYYESFSDGNNYSENQNAKLGIDFYPSTYSTISWSAGVGGRFQDRYEKVNYLFEDSAKVAYMDFLRQNWAIDKSLNFETGLDYRHTFAGTKRELIALANISRNQSDNFDRFINTDKNGIFSHQTLNKDGRMDIGLVQLDYIHPINEKSKFETGVKATLRENDNDQLGLLEDTNNLFATDISNTDHFIFSDQIYALYAQYAGKLKVFEYQLGLRTEQTNIQGNSNIDTRDFSRQYIDLFPSAALKYTYKEKNDFQVNYSRRINRPQNQALNPFRDISDSLSIRVGNPKLDAEYISSYELNYFRRFGEHSISGTLYYRETNNMIVRYRTLDTLTNVTTVTFTNFSSVANKGIEVVIRNQISKAINSMISFNYFRNVIDASNVSSDLQSDNENFSVRGNINLRIKTNTSFQITGAYISPNNQPQGYFKGMSFVDIGMRQELLKGKLSLGINVNDVFDIRKFEVYNHGPGFEINFNRKRESRVLNFTLTYRFGTNDASSLKGKKGNRQAEPTIDMNPDF